MQTAIFYALVQSVGKTCHHFPRCSEGLYKFLVLYLLEVLPKFVDCQNKPFPSGCPNDKTRMGQIWSHKMSPRSKIYLPGNDAVSLAIDTCEVCVGAATSCRNQTFLKALSNLE